MRRAHPSAGTGTHGHGDWMETDRCGSVAHDLLISDARSAGGQPEHAARKRGGTLMWSVHGVGRHRPRRPASRSGTAAKLLANGAHRDATASRNLSDQSE